MIFFPVNELPQKSPNDQSLSKIVLVYDKTDNNGAFENLGFYDFEISEWNHFGRESRQLICWCYVPDPRKFISSNDLKNTLSIVHINK